MEIWFRSVYFSKFYSCFSVSSTNQNFLHSRLHSPVHASKRSPTHEHKHYLCLSWRTESTSCWMLVKHDAVTTTLNKWYRLHYVSHMTIKNLLRMNRVHMLHCKFQSGFKMLVLKAFFIQVGVSQSISSHLRLTVWVRWLKRGQIQELHPHIGLTHQTCFKNG